MKRLLISLLALLYLAAGAGFTLRDHYCMGERIGSVIEHPAHHDDSHRCDRCGMVKKTSDNGCCKDEVKVLKTSPDQMMAKALVMQAPVLVATLPSLPALPQPAATVLPAALPAAPAHGPPLASGVPIFLRVRNLRI